MCVIPICLNGLVHYATTMIEHSYPSVQNDVHELSICLYIIVHWSLQMWSVSFQVFILFMLILVEIDEASFLDLLCAVG
jgi:hypothetical protein